MSKSQMDLTEIGLALKVAEAALDADFRRDTRRQAQFELNEAYRSWKVENGITERLERSDPEYARMMADIVDAYAFLLASKRDEYNADRRLRAAVRKLCLWRDAGSITVRTPDELSAHLANIAAKYPS